MPTSYIRPHKHPGKSEAFHIVEGEVDIVVFKDDGEIDQVVPLGRPGGGRSFYYRMSKPFFHTLIIRSDLLIVHEITNGPFRPQGTDIRRFRARGLRHRRKLTPTRPSSSGASPRCRKRPHERAHAVVVGGTRASGAIMVESFLARGCAVSVVSRNKPADFPERAAAAAFPG